MKFEKKIEKHKKKQDLKKKINKPCKKIWELIDKLGDIRFERKIKRNIKNIDKLKKEALEEIIEKIERRLLIREKGAKVYVYRDADLDCSTISIKHIFTNTLSSSFKKCITYYKTMQVIDKEVDFDYFYKETYRHFKQYEDLTLVVTTKKAWERNEIIASELDLFYIVKNMD